MLLLSLRSSRPNPSTFHFAHPSQFIDLKLPGGGDINWFYMVALSPYAGVYYWRSGDREDNFELKLVEADDLSKVEINVLGDEEEIDRMWRTLNFVEKGMVKVEGLLAE